MRLTFAFVLLPLMCFGASNVDAQPRLVEPSLLDSTPPVQSVTSVHLAPKGMLVLNDAVGRRVLVIDSTLAVGAAILDTLVGTERYYGDSRSRVVGLLADSVVFVDQRTSSLLLTPIGGGRTRVLSIPSVALLRSLVGSPSHLTVSGHVVTRGEPSRLVDQSQAADGSVVQRLSFADSSPIVRFSLLSRAVDTTGWVRQASRMTTQLTRRSNGEQLLRASVNPLATSDEFALSASGQLMIIRGATFELVLPTRNAIALSFDRRSLSLLDRQQIADSVNGAWREFVLDAQRRSGAAFIGEVRDALLRFALGDEGSVRSARGIPRDQDVNDGRIVVESVQPETMPAFRPPLQRDGVRVDSHDNLWILPVSSTAATKQHVAYDVYRIDGAVALRVQFPNRCALMLIDALDRALLRCQSGNDWRLIRTDKIRLEQ